MIGHSWRSSADQSMLLWELPPIKSNDWHQKHNSELTFGGQRNLCPILQRTTMAEGRIPNPSRPRDIPEEESVGCIGMANPHQAAELQQLMMDALQNFHQCI